MDNKILSLGDIARMVSAELDGDPDILVHGVEDFEAAQEGQITFFIKGHDPEMLAKSNASAVIVPHDLTGGTKPLLRVKNPYLAVAVIHNYFVSKPFVPSGISPNAVVGQDCMIPSEVSIGPKVVVGDRVKLGQRVTLSAGVVLGDEVEIGDDSILYPNVTVMDRCRLGSRVIIHSGSVIGSDGFGFATDGQGRHIKRPHVGIVQIDDDVEIGSNVSIDRATFGKTWIRRGTKIDNLVQVGHNVEIGENSLLAGQSGVGGSSVLGKNVVLAGGVGVKDHVRVGDRVIAAGKTGVTSNLPDNTVVCGMPAIPLRQWLRSSAIFEKLPDLAKEIRDLRKQVAELLKKNKGHEDDSSR